MELLTEFRRQLLKKTEKLDSDGFYTKREIATLVQDAYRKAKDECEEVPPSLAE